MMPGEGGSIFLLAATCDPGVKALFGTVAIMDCMSIAIRSVIGVLTYICVAVSVLS